MATLGICGGVADAAIFAAAGAVHLEEHIQKFLTDGDDAAFAARLAAAQAGRLPVTAACCFLPGSLPCVGPAADRAALLAHARLAFARARRAGTSILVFGSGAARTIPEGFDRDTARRQFTDLLAAMAPLAGAEGVTLVIEPLNRKECNFINTVDEGVAIARAVAHPAVRALADFYHMLLDGDSPEAITRAGPLLAHVHLAEREGRRAPGVGGQDFRPFLAALAGIGYRGAISIECGWGDDKAAEAKAGIAEVRRQAAAVGLDLA